jgi:molecular chaperone DnaK (HSP70)
MSNAEDQLETGEASAPARYVVGIDLGTTNCAAAFVDTAEEKWKVSTFSIPQHVAPGTVESLDTLPSFHYQRSEGEFSAGSLKLPWSRGDESTVIGAFARDHGGHVPGRLIASAKSWLCHNGVDRLADLLPWHGAPDVSRLSPVEVSAKYLAHIRAAWNYRFAEFPLEEQDVVVTLPASFDEVARELTVRAAAKAGLPRILLIEEPQAAFYAWINKHGADWEQRVKPGQKILVCDVGGGTSDFTLIRARQQPDGKIQFHRVAVGEHLILGGDNLDLALAQHLESRLAQPTQLNPNQWSRLVRASRAAKETLLGNNPPERLMVHLPSAGAKLIGGGLQVEVTRHEVQDLLVDGFFPKVSLDDKPRGRRTGFQEFGLPYATDAAITRYLAAFLTAHRHSAIAREEENQDHDPARPDVLLFNGGVFASSLLRDRLVDVLSSWFCTTAGWKPIVLDNERHDLAVARGAAYYGMVRRGAGVRIAAGLARSYYIGAAQAGAAMPTAVCLVPAGIEEGESVDLSAQRFQLLVHQPVEFPLYVSSTRLTDRPGEIVAVDPEQMTALPPIRTVLQSSKKATAAETVSVILHVRLTEIGTLDLWFSQAEGERNWRLQFDVRAAVRTDLAGHQGLAERQGIVDAATIDACKGVILDAFRPGSEKHEPEQLVKRLSEVVGQPRDAWAPSLLRELWEVTLAAEPGRRISAIHEGRWLSLLGFSLRPGYGMAVDDWRVGQTWRALQGKLVHGNAMCRAEWWILWRRIAGGLTASQQRGLAQSLIADIRAVHKTHRKGRGAELQMGSHEAAEMWRMLGSLELIGAGWKAELGDMLLDLAAREKSSSIRSAQIWALGRLGTRVPLYGPLNTVVASDVAGAWTKRLIDFPHEVDTAALALMMLARRTDDRYRDVDANWRERAIGWLERSGAAEHYVQLVAQGGELGTDEQGLIFGESLPTGLVVSG